MGKILFLLACFVSLLATIVCTMLYNGALWFVNPQKMGYTVKGVDVSRYQGEIAWDSLADQDIRFAFIKATEGSSHVDPCFSLNYSGAEDAGLWVGGYHFFSFESPGKSQAENFIQTVHQSKQSLPPVLDIELYGRFVREPPSAEQVRKEIGDFIETIEKQYGVAPILYSTRRDYARYIAGYFPACPIWIRDVLRKPKLPDGREFTFWQYSHRGWLEGYTGPEFFIVLNVYSGSWEEFTQQFETAQQ